MIEYEGVAVVKSEVSGGTVCIDYENVKYYHQRCQFRFSVAEVLRVDGWWVVSIAPEIQLHKNRPVSRNLMHVTVWNWQFQVLAHAIADPFVEQYEVVF